MNVGSLLERRPLITVSIKTPISEVMQIMAKKRITAVCVMRRDKLVGIFTMKDVMTKVLGYKTTSLWKTPKKRKIKDVPVRILMSPEPFSVQQLDSLDTALELMRKNKIRHLPVMRGDKIYGLVTLRDVVEGIRLQNMPDKKHAKLKAPLESMYYENLHRQAIPVRSDRA
jgi:CBS domain-containing protein